MTDHIVKLKKIIVDELSFLLQQQLNKLPRKSKKIILEDFNGKVVNNRTDTYPENCEKYSLGLMNDEGERLLNFCALSHLAVMNTMYKQSRNSMTTWISPDGLKKNHIDYVLVSIDQKGLIKNCRVFNSANISSDHSSLMTKYKIGLIKTKHFTRQPKRYYVGPSINDV